jgi:hypothetical protein
MQTLVGADLRKGALRYTQARAQAQARPGQALLSGLGLGLGYFEAQAHKSQAQARAFEPSPSPSITNVVIRTLQETHIIEELQTEEDNAEDFRDLDE